MAEKTEKKPVAVAALAVLPTTPCDAVIVDPDATRTFDHPLDGDRVTITEAERKKSALRMIEKVGVWALKEEIARRKGWK